jgi:hypothetical protein
MDPTPLTLEFKEFLALLNAYNVRYLLVGGYAVGFHGYVRYTKDMDIWVAISVENAAHVAKTIKEFSGSDVDETKFLSTRTLFRIGVPPIRIELMTQIDGVEFDDCYKQREQMAVGETVIDVISLSDLRQNKRASGRPQDLADLDNLP